MPQAGTRIEPVGKEQGQGGERREELAVGKSRRGRAEAGVKGWEVGSKVAGVIGR